MLETLNNWVISANDWIWTYLLIILLILIGLYFTFKSRFVQFRYFGEMFRLLGQGVSNGKGKNSVSSFQAFCIATASRVGTGNLAGVATAVALGGSGAVFWMWVLALIGSASAFVESTLAQIYKEKGERSFIGGPAFYIGKGLKKKGLALLFRLHYYHHFRLGLQFRPSQYNRNRFSRDIRNRPIRSGHHPDLFHANHYFRRDTPDSTGSGYHRSVYGDCLYFSGLIHFIQSYDRYPGPDRPYFLQCFRNRASCRWRTRGNDHARSKARLIFQRSGDGFRSQCCSHSNRFPSGKTGADTSPECIHRHHCHL